MASTQDTIIKKEVWCIPTFAKLLNKRGYKITNVGYCRFGDNCRGAHNEKEITERSDITKWKKRDKSNIDLLAIQDCIIETIKSSLEYVINPKYRSQIQQIDSLPFNQLLHFWYEITCYHRRIFKADKMVYKRHWTDKQSKPPAIEGYHYKDDVPQFKLPDTIEDDVWCLERTLHLCEKNENVWPNEEISIKEICCGDINCKEGVHSRADLVCVDNMLYGECKCPTMEENELQKKEYIRQGDIINKQNTPDLPIQKRNELILQYNAIAKKYKKIEVYVKLIHMTEMGLIPLSIRKAEREKTAPKVVDAGDIEVKTVKKIVKPGAKK